MKLSIIVPYYKTYELTQKLLSILKPQLNEETEVLIVNNSDETLKIGEDYYFNEKVRKGKKENILDILYFYNENREGSIMNG